jgi:hypothetical protein
LKHAIGRQIPPHRVRIPRSRERGLVEAKRGQRRSVSESPFDGIRRIISDCYYKSQEVVKTSVNQLTLERTRTD